MWSHSRIAVQLARYGVIVALALGIVMSVFQIAVDFRKEQDQQDELVSRILKVSAHTAAQATQNLDPVLAGEVAAGLLTYDFIVRVRIVDDLGVLSIDRQVDEIPKGLDWVAPIVGDQILEREIELIEPERGGQVGMLTVSISRRIAMQDFYLRSVVTIGLIIAANLVLLGALTVLYQRLVTRPLSAFTERLLEVSAHDPAPFEDPVGKENAQNELGMMVRATNQILKASRTAMQEASDSQRDLAQREAQFRDFAAAASDWFWETDAHNRIVFVSRRFADLTGLSAEEMIGLTLREFQERHKDLGDDVSELGLGLLHTAMEARTKFRDLPGVIKAVQGPMHVACSGIPIFSKEGTFLGYRGVTRDRSDFVASETERKRLSDTLSHAQKLQAVGQLTGGVAHDFNNLLAVIQGNLELAQVQHPEGRTAELLRSALEATERGAALTHRLLAYARKQPLLPEVIDTRGLLTDFEELLRRTLGEDIELKIIAPNELWRCLADRHQLDTVLLNLGINARDAMPEGGRLVIEAINAHLDADVTGAALDVKPGQYVCIAVTDTGIGMTPDVAAQAFDPFFTTKSAGQGSGLGLSMAFGFAKQSGGHIRLFSEPGQGTTVKLYLPRSAEAKLQPIPRAQPLPIPSDEPTKIMVVEDEQAVRDVVMAHLGSLGYSVIGAGNADEALRIAYKEPEIQLFLLDVVLPGGQSGWVLARNLSKLRPGVKILFMSGYSESAMKDQRQYDRGGVLLQKPFTRTQLSHAIASALGEAAEDRAAG